MLRFLPKTREFLLKNDFIELPGYNKIGTGTFVNVMGFLGGFTNGEYEQCWPTRNHKFDDCYLIWKDFGGKKLNYFTAFLEDLQGGGIFNYMKAGFVSPPTDYYIRPFLVAMHKHYNWKRYGALAACVGGNPPTQFQLKYIQDFVAHMGSQFPYFLFSWSTTISHDDPNKVQVGTQIRKVVKENKPEVA